MVEFRGRRLLLASHVAEQEVADLASEVGAFLAYERSASPVLGLAREVMWELPSGDAFYYGREHPSNASFVVATATTVEGADRLTGILGAHFDVVTDEELLSAADRGGTLEELRVAVVRVGLAVPVVKDDAFSRRIVAAIRAPVPEIREAGLWAASYARWPELDQLIANMAHNDPEELLRGEAQVLLNARRGER